MSEPFIAEIKIWGTNFAPRGWAFCNGQLLPISQNTALFAVIQTHYGGDGETTLALPNLQGRFPLKAGNGAGLTPRSIGESAGQSTVALTESQISNHGHSMHGSVVEGETGTPSGTALLAPARELLGTDPDTAEELTEPRNIYGPDPGASNRVDMAAGSIPPTGSGQAHENRHPWLAINFTIALVGLFPSSS